MIKKLKVWYRNFRKKQLRHDYQEELKEKTKSYDSWVREQESKEKDYEQRKKQAENEKEYYLFVTDPEQIAELAIEEIEAAFAKNSRVLVVYGDEDEEKDGKREHPLFKPEFSPDTLFSYFYFGNLLAVRKESILPFMKTKPNPEQWIITISQEKRRELYEAVLRLCLSLKRENVCHLKKILYHGNSRDFWGYEKEYEDIRSQIFSERKRRKRDMVSIIIPSKDHPEILEQCIRSIRELTQKAEYEIIVVDNGSQEENRKKLLKLKEELSFSYLYFPMEFNFSKMCNLGASGASGSYLLFLNDDCEVKTTLWLYEMVRQAAVEDTGAVGMKLYYPKSRMIQHCGVYGLSIGPVHKLQFQQDEVVHYDRRNRDIRNVLAVTGACLMMRKEVFLKLEGFDEDLQVAFNDVDLCYRSYEAGYHNVVINTHFLWHHESLSRGSDDSKEKRERFLSEKLRLYQKHPSLWWKDPYYHPGFTLDILDVGYSFSYQYENHPVVGKIKRWEKLPKKLREDECVALTLEHCGKAEHWFLNCGKGKEDPEENNLENKCYLQGTLVVLGSDNSCYEKMLVLWEEKQGEYLTVPISPCYRPDVERNLSEQENVALSGFAFLLNLKEIPQGRYRVCGMVRDRISGRYIIRKTSNTIDNS